MANILVQLADARISLAGDDFKKLLAEIKAYPANLRRFDAATKTWHVDCTLEDFQDELEYGTVNNLAAMACRELKNLDRNSFLLRKAESFAVVALQSSTSLLSYIVDPQRIHNQIATIAQRMIDARHPALMGTAEHLAKAIQSEWLASEFCEQLDSPKEEEPEPAEPDMEDALHVAEGGVLHGTPKQIAWARAIMMGSRREIAQCRAAIPQSAKWWIDNRHDIAGAMKRLPT